jgi:hypothetical protein
VLAALLAIVGAVFYYLCLPRHVTTAVADAGRLDLTGFDFADELVALDGQWEFHYGELDTPEQLAATKVQVGGSANAEHIQVPGSWDKAGYPLYGCATYRLTILTSEPELAILIPEISDSARVWANGVEVFQAGQPGADAAGTVSSVRNAIVTARPDSDGRLELVVQAANYGWWASGLRYSFQAGRLGVLTDDTMGRRVVLAGFIGLVVAMFLYHTLFFMSRPRDRVYLLFALTCLAVAVRFSVETNGLASMFMPNGVDLWLTYAYLASVVGQAAGLTFFTHAVFACPVAGWRRRTVYAVLLAGPLLAVCVLPYGTVNTRVVFLALAPLALAFATAVRRRRVRSDPFNLLYLIPIAVMLCWFPIQKILLGDALFMPGVATSLFLVLSQCVMLSMSYANTRRREAALAERYRLYQRISHDLMTPITVVSTNIQVANLSDTVDHDRLDDSQAEIIRMKEMVERILGSGGEDRDVGPAGEIR